MAVGPLDGIDKSNNVVAMAGKHAGYHKAKAKRADFLRLVQEDPTRTIATVCAMVDITDSGYQKWRQRYPQFAAEVDAARGNDPIKAATTWANGFAAFRKHFFGMDSPWFHLEVVDALENGEPGSVTLILLPPEHGKTTLLEDFCDYQLATNPAIRIGYASEKQSHAKKALGRIKGRLEQFGGFPDLVNRFGPFAPEQGVRSSQPWGSEFFNIRKKGNHDERDYSMVALGVGAAVAGSRFDLLLIDDVQSNKSLNATDKIVETVRQDWFSRPGSKGRTVIVGTRVGEDDVYERLMDEVDEVTGKPLIDRVIKYAAIRTDVDTGEPIYLWPERYNPDEYDIMRRKAGPLAWSRNYQQQPIVKGTITFSDEVMEHALLPLHSWEMPIPNEVRELALTIDPALGGQNAIEVQGWAPDYLMVLDTKGDWGLTSTEQILSLAADLLAMWVSRPRVDGTLLSFTTVVIEEAAYQKSLVNDERLHKLQEQYGFAVMPHQTGSNKNDPDLGITGMVYGMYSKQVRFPAATDVITRERIGTCVAEFKAWRPNRRGTKLKMDKVMATWFGWLVWRNRRHTLIEPTAKGDASPWKREGLPFTPTPRVPLLQRVSPFRTGNQRRSTTRT